MYLYGSGHEITVTLADRDLTDSFGSLVDCLNIVDSVSLLQGLGVDDDKLKGLVCANALRQAGLD